MCVTICVKNNKEFMHRKKRINREKTNTLSDGVN